MSGRKGTKGLELWCRKMTEGYPGVKIDNMTTSWRDGLAFCAIIHRFRPDLIDFPKLNKDDVYHNNELAFRIAEQYLNIPALLDPEDMVEYQVPDRLSILTYLSQFYQAFACPQGSSASRLASKRPAQTSPDGTGSPTSSSPLTKISTAGAGILRKERCARCELPVFLAERLNVGKLHFHRTCFKCARCGSLLTVGYYYETESGDICCEVCPDEEKSTTERLLLQRSMSDEEKSASLRTHCNEPDDYSTLFETALESVTSKASDEFTEARSQFIQSQMISNSDSGNEENSYDAADEVTNSESASKNIVETVNYNSGLPSVSDKFSHKFEETQDVTKDQPDDVKLSQNKDILKHSELEQECTSSRNGKDLEISEEVTDTKIGLEVLCTGISNDSKATRKMDYSNSKDLGIGEGVTDTEIGLEVCTGSSNDSKATRKMDYSNSKDLGIGEGVTDTEIKQEECTCSTSDSITPKRPDDSNSNDLGIGTEVTDTKNELIISSEEVAKDSGDIETIDLTRDSENNTDDKETIDLTRDSENNPDDSAFNCSEASTRFIESIASDVIVIDDSVTDESAIEQSKLIETSCVGEAAPGNKTDEYYPTELNPFGDEDNEGAVLHCTSPRSMKPTPIRRLKKIFPNEEDKIVWTPGRVIPKRISINPFEEDEDEDSEEPPVPVRRLKKIFPSEEDKIVWTPGRVIPIRISINPFEEDEDEDSEEPPVPVRRRKIPAPKISLSPLESGLDYSETVEESEAPVPAPRSLEYPGGTPEAKPRSAHHCGTLSPSSRSGFGSNSSLSSGSAYGSTRYKKPAPRPPIPTFRRDESPGSSLTSSPSHSVHQSPRSTPKYRKSKKAPPPPPVTAISSTPSKEEEEFAQNESGLVGRKIFTNRISLSPIIKETGEEGNFDNDVEKEKLVKDETNRTRQGQETNKMPSNEPVSLPDKSTTGKWKRRKGQAPSRPVIARRTVRCLPMAEIKKELELIETQQQGLERQGVRIEKIIRQKCEGSEEGNPDADLPIEVEDLILQLFELVNEKNELFRKQTELMYLRRQQRLEEEHAEIEYQLRCLMCQPEANKTDSDKAREEQLLQRLIEVVEKRNDIVECLESDRIREEREDSSISDHINLYTTKRDEKSESEKSAKEKEKDKKKHKKLKKLKLFKVDTVKYDPDESSTSQKKNATLKKEKKKFTLF